MPKTIVAKTEINKDVGLSIIKAFRVTNKRAGEAKQKGAVGHEEFLQFCAHLRDLTEKAEAGNFKIWVNVNGTTGHTYDLDYKETPDSANDYEQHERDVAVLAERDANDELRASADINGN